LTPFCCCLRISLKNFEKKLAIGDHPSYLCSSSLFPVNTGTLIKKGRG
jgi:hypothetical protein